MTAVEPSDLHRLLALAVTDRYLDAYLKLYEPRRGGGMAVGLDAIREKSLQPCLPRHIDSVHRVSVVHAVDIALMHSRGAYSGVAPDGSLVHVPEHPAAEVARRQPDGTWLLIVNDPWGPPLTP